MTTRGHPATRKETGGWAFFPGRKRSRSPQRTQPNSDPRKVRFTCNNSWSPLDERRRPQRQHPGSAAFRGCEWSHRVCIAEKMREKEREGDCRVFEFRC